MSRSTGRIEAPVYLQIEPEFGGRYGDDEAPVRRAKVVGATQKRPDRPRPGVVLLKLTVSVPAAAFYPLRPEATVVIPESLTELTEIRVDAEDPHAPSGGES